jgi:hypothetical protein
MGDRVGTVDAILDARECYWQGVKDDLLSSFGLRGGHPRAKSHEDCVLVENESDSPLRFQSLILRCYANYTRG